MSRIGDFVDSALAKVEPLAWLGNRLYEWRHGKAETPTIETPARQAGRESYNQYIEDRAQGADMVDAWHAHQRRMGVEPDAPYLGPLHPAQEVPGRPNVHHAPEVDNFSRTMRDPLTPIDTGRDTGR